MTFQINDKRSTRENPTDRQERITWWSQQRLRQSKVMVVGAGALGNEVIKNLALMGVGYQLVVDFDHIETSNLSRTALFRREDVGKSKAETAALRAREINVEPSARIDFVHGDVVWDVGLGVYRRMDLIIGCLDNVEARLAINQACILTGKPLIDGGIRELAGSVYLFAPPFSCCFSCTTTKRERHAAGDRYDSCFQVMLRGQAEEKMATVQLTSAIIAGLQSEQAIKYLHGDTKQAGIRIQYDGNGRSPYFDVTKIRQRAGCECQFLQPLDPVRTLPGSFKRVTMGNLLDRLRATGLEDPVVKLPSSFVPYLVCSRCGHETTLMQPLYRLTGSDIACEQCRLAADRESLQLMPVADSFDIFDDAVRSYRRQLLDRTLHQFGFPALHAIQVEARNQDTCFFELPEDETLVLPSLTKPQSQSVTLQQV